MPVNFSFESLGSAATPFGVVLTQIKCDALHSYVRAALTENMVTNVTAVRTEADAAERLVLDALAIGLHLRECPLGPGSVVADMGTGGGFPGVILALVWPEWKVHLIESRGRKLEVVRRALMGITEAQPQLHVARMEAVASGPLRGRCNMITCRAVGALADVLPAAVPALQRGGTIVVWKSAEIPAEELAAATAAARALGLEILTPLHYTSYKPSQLVRFRKL